MLTDKLISILVAVGGNPATLPDRLENTIIDAIYAAISTESAVTADEVVTAFGAMTADQITAVKTALGITESTSE